MVPGKNDNEYITSLEPAFFSKEKVTPAKVLTKGDGLQTSLEKKSDREKLPFKKFSIINPVPDKEVPESLRSWLESETGESITVDDIIEISSKYKYNLNTIPMGRLGSSKPDFSLIADPASVVFKDMPTFERKSAAKHLAAVTKTFNDLKKNVPEAISKFQRAEALPESDPVKQQKLAARYFEKERLLNLRAALSNEKAAATSELSSHL
jgi:hypothetical protein